MPEAKFQVLETFRSLAASSPNTYMWFAIPGGMISGKPAKDYADWIKGTTNRDLNLDRGPVPVETSGEKRFILLKDARLRQGEVEIIVGAAVVDCLSVSAWGYRTPPPK